MYCLSLLKFYLLVSIFSTMVFTAGAQVRLTENAIDSSAGNLPCYKIQTPQSIYYLEKEGAGLSSLIDREGNDWIGFHPKENSGAGGEYRGFPNAVHQGSVILLDRCTTTLLIRGSEGYEKVL